MQRVSDSGFCSQEFRVLRLLAVVCRPDGGLDILRDLVCFTFRLVLATGGPLFRPVLACQAVGLEQLNVMHRCASVNQWCVLVFHGHATQRLLEDCTSDIEFDLQT